jgi:ABC-2 type transport system ATP-binding protein
LNFDPLLPADELPVLTARNVCKQFGKKEVLRGINLDLYRGKLYGIVGENGSGKSTLLNILAGFLKASEGNTQIRGKVGFCPQEPFLFSNLKVSENINWFSYAYGLKKNKNSNYYDEHKKLLFDTFDFSESEKELCSNLSTGTRQKLNLIVSLLNDPDLLLLDEPYSALDWETYIRFWEFSHRLKELGKTILIVSHLIYDKSKMDYIWKLKNGILECN